MSLKEPNHPKLLNAHIYILICIQIINTTSLPCIEEERPALVTVHSLISSVVSNCDKYSKKWEEEIPLRTKVALLAYSTLAMIIIHVRFSALLLHLIDFLYIYACMGEMRRAVIGIHVCGST